MSDETSTNPSGKATRAMLLELHRALLKCLLERLSKPNVKASLLDVARKFLLDNGVSQAVREEQHVRDALEKLQEDTDWQDWDLPFLGDEHADPKH